MRLFFNYVDTKNVYEWSGIFKKYRFQQIWRKNSKPNVVHKMDCLKKKTNCSKKNYLFNIMVFGIYFLEYLLILREKIVVPYFPVAPTWHPQWLLIQ